jgi:CDGSH-type Zn-finger protein/uncharacterized Fe-S cluster protein YjdI
MEEVRGAKVTILYEGARCIHSRYCVTGEPKLFVGNVEGDWIFPDAVSAEEAVRVALACPSGAIGYERHDGGPQETPPPVNIVRLMENGPLAFRADMRLGGSAEGKAIGYRATLCRCGQSKNKPFCDGAHHETGFTASGEPPSNESPALAVRDGPVTITPTKNGPLMVEGNLEICCGTGRVIERTQKTFLCRCGGSKTKPFCDNSHKKNGFTAP